MRSTPVTITTGSLDGDVARWLKEHGAVVDQIGNLSVITLRPEVEVTMLPFHDHYHIRYYDLFGNSEPAYLLYRCSYDACLCVITLVQTNLTQEERE